MKVSTVLLALASAAVTLALTGTVAARPSSSAEVRVLTKIFASGRVDSTMFAGKDSWVNALAANAMIGTCRSDYGPFEEVRATGPHAYRIVLRRGSCYARIRLGPHDLIETLTIETTKPSKEG